MEALWERGVDLAANAPPFERNPSSWRQRVPICLLALLGVAISGYMALYQWGLLSTVWDPVWGQGGTPKVLESATAKQLDELLRLPDAAFGAWAYLSEVVFGLVGCTRRWQYRPWMVLLFGVDVIPLGFVSAGLVVAQGAIVGAWCFLCLVTAAISLTLVVLAYDEVWATLKYLRRVWRASGHDKKLLWDTFCGRPSPTAEAVALQKG